MELPKLPMQANQIVSSHQTRANSKKKNYLIYASSFIYLFMEHEALKSII